MASLTAFCCRSSSRSHSACKRSPSRCCAIRITRSVLRVGLSVLDTRATRCFKSSTVRMFKASSSVRKPGATFFDQGIAPPPFSSHVTAVLMRYIHRTITCCKSLRTFFPGQNQVREEKASQDSQPACPRRWYDATQSPAPDDLAPLYWRRASSPLARLRRRRAQPFPDPAPLAPGRTARRRRAGRLAPGLAVAPGRCRPESHAQWTDGLGGPYPDCPYLV